MGIGSWRAIVSVLLVSAVQLLVTITRASA
jgi:hypothetical protein